MAGKAHEGPEVENGLSTEPVDDPDRKYDTDELHHVGDAGVDELLLSCESEGAEERGGVVDDWRGETRFRSVDCGELKRTPWNETHQH